jgi:hypothetical protein
MNATTVLVIFNALLSLLAVAMETINLARDYRRHSRFAPLRLWSIGLVFVATSVAVYSYISGLVPPFSPMRIAYTLVLIYIVTRGTYDLVAR